MYDKDCLYIVLLLQRMYLQRIAFSTRTMDFVMFVFTLVLTSTVVYCTAIHRLYRYTWKY